MKPKKLVAAKETASKPKTQKEIAKGTRYKGKERRKGRDKETKKERALTI